MNTLRLAVALLVSFILQGSVFSRITFGGAAINLSIPFVVNIGLLLGPIPASLCGLVIGLIEDIQTGYALGVRALLYFVIGFVTGILQKHMNRDDPKPAMVWTAVSTLLFFFSNAFINRIMVNTVGFLVYLKGPILIETVLNAAMAWILYHILRRFIRIPGLYS